MLTTSTSVFNTFFSTKLFGNVNLACVMKYGAKLNIVRQKIHFMVEHSMKSISELKERQNNQIKRMKLARNQPQNK